MKSLRCLAFITFCLFLFSCSKDNEYMADDEITNNKDLSDKNQSDKNQSDTSSKNQTFYFRMESQVPPLGNKNAGTIEMVFDTNSEWEACITSSSFKNGCYIDGQSQGKGRGVIIIKYGKAENGCDCDESATITITYVDRIDKDGEKHYDRNTYSIRRYYCNLCA
ncbi:MAG: hypothetical protein EGQ88_05145 [Prevotellamassilia timonensis]|nr:hypothetical protein [Prevotellamassilia timonensis]